jgi:hypothetical protein
MKESMEGSEMRRDKQKDCEDDSRIIHEAVTFVFLGSFEKKSPRTTVYMFVCTAYGTHN